MVITPCLFYCKGDLMRAIRKYFFPLLLSLTIFLSTGISTYAMADGNIDGGGGSFGTGSELNVWRNNQDGVRVTVVTTGGSVVATPIDLSNCNISSTVLNFGNCPNCNILQAHRFPLMPPTPTQNQPSLYQESSADL